MKKLIILIDILTSIFIISYWILIFFGILSFSDIVPGYKVWSYSFIIPDIYLVVFLILSVITLLLNTKYSKLFGFIISSSLIFNGIIVISYGITAKILFKEIQLLIMSSTIFLGIIQILYFSKTHKIK